LLYFTIKNKSKFPGGKLMYIQILQFVILGIACIIASFIIQKKKMKKAANNLIEASVVASTYDHANDMHIVTLKYVNGEDNVEKTIETPLALSKGTIVNIAVVEDEVMLFAKPMVTDVVINRLPIETVLRYTGMGLFVMGVMALLAKKPETLLLAVAIIVFALMFFFFMLFGNSQRMIREYTKKKDNGKIIVTKCQVIGYESGNPSSIFVIYPVEDTFAVSNVNHKGEFINIDDTIEQECDIETKELISYRLKRLKTIKITSMIISFLLCIGLMVLFYVYFFIVKPK
jgi:hypothetical protein